MEGSEGGLLASESSRRAFPAFGQWLPRTTCGGLLSVTVAGPRRTFTGFPVHRSGGLDFAASYRRSGQRGRPAAAAGFRLRIVKRSGEPGANPGLTRNGDGRGATAKALAPSPNAHRSTQT
jgi:hypothetical protein